MEHLHEQMGQEESSGPGALTSRDDMDQMSWSDLRISCEERAMRSAVR